MLIILPLIIGPMMSAVCKSNLTVDIRAAAMCPSRDACFWTGLLDLHCFHLGAAVVFVLDPTNILLRKTHHVVRLSVCFLSQRREVNTSELRAFTSCSPPLRRQELIFPSKLCSLVRTTAALVCPVTKIKFRVFLEAVIFSTHRK